MYNKTIMEIFANPKNVGIIQGASGTGHFVNETTNNIYKIYLKIEDDTVVDATFKTFSNAYGIAVCSVLTQMLKGKSLLEAKLINQQDILEKIGEVDKDDVTINDVLQTLNLSFVDYDKKLQKLLKSSKN
ncbi:MAG: iron-sulfur cluster assembly scaffold protein [Christensenellales bacterium]